MLAVISDKYEAVISDMYVAVQSYMNVAVISNKIRPKNLNKLFSARQFLTILEPKLQIVRPMSSLNFSQGNLFEINNCVLGVIKTLNKMSLLVELKLN